jgi:hypothetical protein
MYYIILHEILSNTQSIINTVTTDSSFQNDFISIFNHINVHNDLSYTINLHSCEIFKHENNLKKGWIYNSVQPSKTIICKLSLIKINDIIINPLNNWLIIPESTNLTESKGSTDNNDTNDHSDINDIDDIITDAENDTVIDNDSVNDDINYIECKIKTIYLDKQPKPTFAEIVSKTFDSINTDISLPNINIETPNNQYDQYDQYEPLHSDQYDSQYGDNQYYASPKQSFSSARYNQYDYDYDYQYDTQYLIDKQQHLMEMGYNNNKNVPQLSNCCANFYYQQSYQPYNWTPQITQSQTPPIIPTPIKPFSIDLISELKTKIKEPNYGLKSKLKLD